MIDPSRIKALLAEQGHDAHVRVVAGQVEAVRPDGRPYPEAQAAASALAESERARPRTPAERLRDLGLDPVRAALVLVEVGTTEEAAIAEVILADELARVRRALGGSGDPRRVGGVG